LEARGEALCVIRTGDNNGAILHGLSKRFQNAATKLGDLIQEQDAAMGEGDLAW